jgi:D-alanyl-D-alanine carboxypeptidase/D-alanyl-D-alanine-endopeptidase (penicillin-binding protein 4)
MSMSVRIAVMVSALVAVPALVGPAALAQGTDGEQALRSALAAQMARGPAEAGAYVVDLGDGHVVFSDRGGVPR